MAENKNTVVVYKNWRNIFQMLEDDEAGKLIKHFFNYINDENPELHDRLLMMAFEPIKDQLKRDLKSWESTIEKRSEAGKASAEAKRIAKLKQQNSTNSTHVDSVQQTSTKSTVNDNVNVTDNVTDNVIKIKEDIVARKLKFSSTLEPFVKIYGRSLLNDFNNYWTEPNKSNTKFRQELERTWDVERRLQTWSKNDKNFNNSEIKKPLDSGNLIHTN